jgi:predicted Fe-Mo cluster-binding NifX family protein
MKICIPTDDDRGVEGRACGDFGRAPFFTLVDPDTGDAEVLPNPDCHAHPGACHHIPQLRAHGVSVVVCEGLGRRAADALIEAGIETRRPAGVAVAEIVEQFRRDETRPLTADGAGAWRHRRRRRERHGHGRFREEAGHGARSS